MLVAGHLVMRRKELYVETSVNVNHWASKALHLNCMSMQCVRIGPRLLAPLSMPTWLLCRGDGSELGRSIGRQSSAC